MGYGTRKTAYIETEVDVDLDDFDEDDLINYLEEKGYTVMEGKNKSKFETFEALDKQIWKLYLTYVSASNDVEMRKQLGAFFAEYYNKVNV